MKMITPDEDNGCHAHQQHCPETDHAAWVAGTTYALGAYCPPHIHASDLQELAGRQYRAFSGRVCVDMVGFDVGPTNRWACFDNIVSTQTSAERQ